MGLNTPLPGPVARALVTVRFGSQDDRVGRTIEEVTLGTGSWGRQDPDDLMAGLQRQAPARDTDNDGRPDTWEKAHNLNPEDGTDHTTLMASGYTAIEQYCNMLAQKLIEGAGRQT